MDGAAIEVTSSPRRTAGAAAAPRVATIAGLISTVAAAVVSGALFLPRQSLWVDEVTQLSGLTLSPVQIVRWLADSRAYDFGVPADRMPPLAYWLGSAWAHLFGLTAVSLRWFGVVCTGIGVGLLFRAANRLFGLRAAIFAAAFLALSPNVCALAVEIRAYPLFLLTAAGALDALSFLLVDREGGGTTGAWLRLALWLAAACATHFFGLVLSGAMLVGLTLFFGGAQRKRLAALAAGIAMVAVALVPFVRGSVAMSQGGEPPHRLHDVAQLLYRQVTHPAMWALPVTIPAVLAAAAALAFFALQGRQIPAVRALVAILLAGLGVTIAAAFVVRGFSAAKTTYATWALPLLSLILAAPTAELLACGRRAPVAGALIFLAAETLASWQLWWHGEHFAHGPMNQVAQIIDKVGAQDTAIIHVDSPAYVSIYFPVRFLYGPGLPQFVVGSAVPLGQPLAYPSDAWRQQVDRFRHLVLIRSKQQRGLEVGAQVRHGDRPFAPDSTLSALSASPPWRVQSHEEVVSLVAADVTVLERAN
jgi:uncharacterized membrane protein